MAKYPWVQNSFSGGEISERMWMRDDTEQYANSVRYMTNFMPTLQGSAVRTPGSRHLQELRTQADAVPADVRLIPYLTPADEEAVLVLMPGEKQLIVEPLQGVAPDTSIENQAGTTVTVFEVVNPNWDFSLGEDSWTFDPNWGDYYDDEIALGCRVALFPPLGSRTAWIALRWYKRKTVEPQVGYFKQTFKLPEASDRIELAYLLQANPESFGGSSVVPPDSVYTVELKIGTTDGGQDVYYRKWTNQTESDYIWEARFADQIAGTFAQDQDLYVELLASVSDQTGEKPNQLYLFMDYLQIRSKVTKTIDTEGPITSAFEYTAPELQDIQYIQSPYPRVATNTDMADKELVLVHPNHAPARLWLDGGAYTFEAIPFDYTPTVWTDGGAYPSVVTAFNGRLMLAGAMIAPNVGSIVAAGSETVWGTRVGEWHKLTEVDPAFDPTLITAASAMTFTGTYRSPIQWMHGHKDLLIGARELEYAATADNLFQPNDIGVFKHTEAGSINVQPASFGESVVFAADGGRKAREMNLQNADQGWVAPDLTLLNPEILDIGVKRMVRLKNPHQMLVVLKNDGDLAICHIDTRAGIRGWSRIFLPGFIKDICVIQDEAGRDVLMLANQLTYGDNVGENKKVHLEAIVNWYDGAKWDYVSSSVEFVSPTADGTNVITGLNHLVGKSVQVVGQGARFTDSYLGTYRVALDGTLTLENQVGEPINVTRAIIGLSMKATLETLPFVTQYPDARKRFSDVGVRVRNSTVPIINGYRPPERRAQNDMNTSQKLIRFNQRTMTNLGWDDFEFIRVEEVVPLRTEILGIFGEISINNT